MQTSKGGWLMRNKTLRIIVLPALFILLAVPALIPAARADEDRDWRIDAETLEIRNLIGEVEVTGTGGDEFIVKAHVRGKDADSEGLDFDLVEGTDAELSVLFPVDEYSKFHYPEGHGKSTFSDWDSRQGSILSKILRFATASKITVSNKRGDVQIWCDLEVELPRGKALRIDHGVGEMSARDAEGEIYLSTNSGSVTIESCKGEIVGDTGSGHIKCYDVEGDVVMDTGSGHVTGENLRGDRINADTGSGHVELTHVRCEELIADTGSGHVDIADAEADDISVDTGSGSVKLRGVRGRDIVVDTGSGRVDVDLRETPPGRLLVDTGSGGISLRLPEDPNCSVNAETGAGRVSLDVSDISGIRRDDDELRVTIGDGDMRIRLDSGSGHIEIEEG